MNRPVLSILLLTLLALPAPLAFGRGRHEPGPAPDFTLPTASGNVSLKDLRGKVVFVDFWASWCGPCRQSFPWMAGMFERYSPQGLVIVSINLDKKRDAADAFLDQFTTPFTVAFDPSGRTAEAYRVEAMPSSFIISRTGQILHAHAGFELAGASKVEDEIKEALAR